MSNPPEVALWLTVPNDCRMCAEFENGDLEFPDIHIILGSNQQDQNLLFEREALTRFVELAQRILAIPVANEGPLPQLTLVSRSGFEIREEPPRWAVVA